MSTYTNSKAWWASRPAAATLGAVLAAACGSEVEPSPSEAAAASSPPIPEPTAVVTGTITVTLGAAQK